MIYKMLPKIWKNEVLCFKSKSDVLAFDKIYESCFNKLGGSIINWEYIMQANWEYIIKEAWAYINGNKIRWCYHDRSNKIIKYWKNLSYDL